MKKIGILFFMLVAFCLNAQTNCETALPFCAGGTSGVTFPATTGTPAAQPGPNYGCLSTTPNPAWYYLQISTSGSLDILIEGQITTPPPAIPGQDVDFIAWGPFNSLAGICNSLTAANTIDCSYSGSFTETLNIPNGIAGEYYMVLITNFANIQQDIVFTQYAGNGTTNCSLLSNNSKICAGSNATILATNSGSLTNPTYSINPGGITSTTGSFVVTPSVTTDYTVYIHGTNNVNVPVTQTAVSTVSVYAQPSAAPTLTNSTCTSTLSAFDLGLSFFPPNPAPGYTVNWSSIPNVVNSPTQTAASGLILPGLYTATITAAGGCSATTNVSINPIPAPAIIAVNPLGTNHVITCISDVTLTALNASYNYTWSSNVGVYNTPVVVFTSTSVAVWTLLAENPASGCMATQSFVITQNTTPPTSTVSPLLQSITCNSSIMTVTATANPLVNITHNIISPQGGTYSAQSHSVIYTPGGIGTFTHCVINDVNGCSVCTTFTVSSNQLFPTYTLTSPQNFTLGCTTTSIANINIVGAAAGGGGAASYTVIGPPTSTAIVSGTLSGQSTYSVNVPGTWTVVVRDNVSFCETRTPVSILSQTLSPDISAIVPTLVLDCNVPKMTLKGQSTTPNVSYQWAYPATPGIVQGDTITVNSRTLFPTSPVVADYTLTITNNISTCKSFSVISIQQNLFPPKAVISNGGVPAITCKTSSLTLTNQSSTTIPPNLGFPYQNPIVGYIWEGPSPQEPSQLKTTYVAATTGIYTLTVKDMNNGCLAKTTATVGDRRIFPAVNKLNPRKPDTLFCGVASKKITANLTNTVTPYTYNWISSGVPTGTNVLPTFEVSQPGVYRVIITDPSNGCSTSDEVTVVTGSLTADFDVQSAQGYAPFTATFFNNSYSSAGAQGAQDILAYWNFGNGTTMTTTANNLSPATTYTLPGVYKITMYAIKGACIDTDSATITVDIPSVMEIPNVFTPNGDNVNDFFFIKASNLAEISAVIFDRWGHKVYEVKTDKGNIEWDGKNQAGKDMAEGTYFYTIKATGKDGVPYNKKGTLSLFR